ncbi:P-loop containing nucleoside triphosphate hydrolase protein [Chytridium lagenaria]|nr:P-loop containing nucleoside triphosphate hydrolase protein [Chytridium lagenaria]
MFRNPIFTANGVLERLLKDGASSLRLGCTLRNLYRLVLAFPSLSTLWTWSVVYQLYEGLRPSILKAYAVFTISYVLQVTDAERDDMYKKYVGGKEASDYSRLIRAVEKALDDEEAIWLFSDLPGAASSTTFEITRAALSPYSVALADVLLPKVSGTAGLDTGKVLEKGELVMTKSTFKNMRSIGLGVSLGSPVLLEGPPGVGKTFLVEEASKIVSESSLLVAHIGDQTDSKILLGTYVSQAEPGQFKWVPGILTTAVMEGRWLLIEDIDLAPAEVVSVLLPLLEARHLFIAARGEKIQAKEGFQLFATRTVFSGRSDVRSLQPSDLLSKSSSTWFRLRVPTLPEEEVAEIIRERYPVLAHVSNIIIKVFMGMRAYFAETVGMTRTLSIRDLFKWCARIAKFGGNTFSSLDVHRGELQLQNREDFFREGVDCFCLMIQKAALWRQACDHLGELLEIPTTRVEFYLEHFLPAIKTSSSTVVVGRSAIEVNPKSKKVSDSKDSTFAMTRSSVKLMERLAICVHLNEPVLLVGETGTGKTTAIQHLATLSGTNLVVMNLSQQSDSSDLLGGFKPVDARMMTVPFAETTFSATSNAAFIETIRNAVAMQKWDIVKQGFANALKMAEKVLGFSMDGSAVVDSDQSKSRKRAKKLSEDPTLMEDWKSFANAITSYNAQLEHSKSSFLFQFIEGSLVKAIIRGDWVLLDEVNLASSETLEHPNFRIFACMNPATDAGKRDLPPGILSRLSEIWVDAPDSDRQDLLLIIRQHLHRYLPPPAQGGDIICSNIADFHLAAKAIMDAGNSTLSRALAYARTTAPTFGLQRALYEGFLMTFTTMLSADSFVLVDALITQHVLAGIRNPKAFVKTIPKRPGSAEQMVVDDGVVESDPITSTHVLFNAFWLEACPHYVITESVEKNLKALARAVTAQKFPILIQGPTSAGKTSMIEYLAKRTGHTFVRVNNHEHTDIQEYIGSYAPDSNGQLVFPLNRLLDDNRELLIPETQEVVKPHKNFMLFATQNPLLSRAFRSRFLELHFDDIPEGELATILEKRCRIAPSYADRIVKVYRGLRVARQRSRIFEGKNAFATLRDLFRWANRGAGSWEGLAEDGYMLLAERARRTDEKVLVKEVLETEMKVKLDPDAFYDRAWSKILMNHFSHFGAMKRLLVLVDRSLSFKEPILLVGETAGQSDIKGLLDSFGKRLEEVSDADDLKEELTKLYPLEERTRSLFEWRDGPLITAMRQGHAFLLDELSLADDSVLERLNSVLESERQIVLAEKGLEVEQITAAEKFCFFATMNPGGDYGKKELSPALRNRFTEIWVPQISDRDDLLDIIGHKLSSLAVPPGWSVPLPNIMLDFLEWLASELNKTVEAIISMRDILAWVSFILKSSVAISIDEAFVHGGGMVFADGIGVNPLFGITSTLTASKLRGLAIEKLHSLAQTPTLSLLQADNCFGCEPFYIRRGPHPPSSPPFSMKAPTTSRNVMKVLRALRVQKPILLEGSPGVGKTSLISSLAAVCGYKLCRINLSDQTDLMDLFGSDLPVEGGMGGEFAWRDGPFLHAMNQGDWVLLDELNLASQQVLEGLNACLDHRGEVYIPELDRTFFKHPNFRVFAAQNPQNEGGGRKGLPKSFVNRFTQVYVDGLSGEDLSIIANSLFPSIGADVVVKMIDFNQSIHEETTLKGSFGQNGSPWEFNLRDVLRWMELTEAMPRISTLADRVEVGKVFKRIFGRSIDAVGSSKARSPFFLTPDLFVIGSTTANRNKRIQDHRMDEAPVFLDESKYIFESLAISVKMNWTALLVGPSGSGKTSMIRSFASLAGQQLVEFCMNPSIDASELIGGFEQLDISRIQYSIAGTLRNSLQVLLSFEVAGIETICEKVQEIFSAKEVALREHFESVGAVFPVDILAAIEDYRRKSSASLQGRFEWIDGSLIKAMESGDWILIDNVNLCPASVLDRLNSLLEPNGFLAVSERGIIGDSVKILRPHANFRMFLAMDPKFGELSRAMRNRSLEISQVLDADSHLFDICLAKGDASADSIAQIGSQMLSGNDAIRFSGLVSPKSANGDFTVEESEVADTCTRAKRIIDCLDEQKAAESVDAFFAAFPSIADFRTIFDDIPTASHRSLLLGGLRYFALSRMQETSSSSIQLLEFLAVIFSSDDSKRTFNLSETIASTSLMVKSNDIERYQAAIRSRRINMASLLAVETFTPLLPVK